MVSQDLGLEPLGPEQGREQIPPAAGLHELVVEHHRRPQEGQGRILLAEREATPGVQAVRPGEVAGKVGPLLRQRFDKACARLGLNSREDFHLDTTQFRPPGREGQGTLF